MAYTPDYDKWQQHKKALEKFDEAYKAEVDALYEKQKGIFKQLNEEQLAALKEEETIEKKLKIREIWSIILAFPCIAGIYIALALAIGIGTREFNNFAFLITIGSFFGGTAICILIIQPLLGMKKLEKKSELLKEDELIKEYFSIRDTIKEKTEKYNEEREYKVKECAKYSLGSTEEPDSVVWRAVLKFFEDANNIQKEEELKYTHRIHEDGYDRDLRKFDNGGGYDEFHGWHDVYKDDLGRSWGTTDDGKTFFKKD
ncbi:MAG: hypothetical protein J6R88_00245 [Clostridia bacterium]|nr:hypothetical protein [Clostridia bacterium]